jgi:RecA-family ATPase
MTTQEQAERIRAQARQNLNGRYGGVSGKRLSEVEPERITWLWHGRLAEGKMTVLDGDPGLGKSTAVLDIAARISTGAAFPQSLLTRDPAGVVLLSAEDGLADTIRPRMEVAAADLGRVFAMTGVLDMEGTEQMVTIPGSLGQIEKAIEDVGAKLLIIDPLFSYLDRDVNANNDQQVRTALRPLAEMLERTRCAAIMLRHLNKADAKNVLYRGGGSIGIIGAARFGLVVAKDPEDEHKRVVAVSKCNLAQEPPSLRYGLESVQGTDVAKVVWGHDAAPYSAADLLGPPEDKEELETHDEAAEWLRHYLDVKAVTVQQVLHEGKKMGYGERALRRARKTLGVVAQPDGYGGEWVYRMPTRVGEEKAPWE